MISTLQQRRYLGMDEGAIPGIVDRISGTVSVDRRNRMQFGRSGVDEPAKLIRVVAHIEISIRLPRHQQNPRLDRRQRVVDVAAEFSTPADIATLPNADLRQEIVGVTPCEGAVP